MTLYEIVITREICQSGSAPRYSEQKEMSLYNINGNYKEVRFNVILTVCTGAFTEHNTGTNRLERAVTCLNFTILKLLDCGTVYAFMRNGE